MIVSKIQTVYPYVRSCNTQQIALSMADGAEVITLDSDDEADSSNHIPDQNRSSSGGMVYDPANYADLMAQVAQARLAAPAVKTIAEKQIKAKTFTTPRRGLRTPRRGLPILRQPPQRVKGLMPLHPRHLLHRHQDPDLLPHHQDHGRHPRP